MNEAASQLVLVGILVFCRIGACLMLLPGVGGRSIPMQVRVFIGVALTMAFMPVVYTTVAPKVTSVSIASLLAAICAELLIGALLGFLVRIYITALETLMNFAAQSVGLSGIAGISVDDGGSLPSVATLFAFTAISMLFISDLHLELIRGMLESYRKLPPGTMPAFGATLAAVVDQFGETFLIALRIASPFVMYSIGMNLAVGLINKFTPQISVYFIAGPFITAGGILLLYVGMAHFMSLFVLAFGNWLRTY